MKLHPLEVAASNIPPELKLQLTSRVQAVGVFGRLKYKLNQSLVRKQDETIIIKNINCYRAADVKCCYLT